MNKEKARNLLDKQKAQLKNNLKKYQKAENGIEDNELGVDILGPRNDLENQRLKKEIEESENNES
jgi:hypothetical protein